MTVGSASGLAPPNFFLLGAAKAGTTSLHDALANHPAIGWSSVKEPGFFCSSAEYQKGVDYYLKSYFRGAHDRPARGEATPWYFPSPDAPTRLRESLGDDLRFVVLLRDPVRRAHSQYWMMVRKGVESESFEDAIASDGRRIREDQHGNRALCYAYCSHYAESIDRWASTFSQSERFLYVLFDDLVNQPGDVLRRVQEFLGVGVDTNRALSHHNPASADRFGVMRRVNALPQWMRSGAGRFLSEKSKTRLWQLVDQVDRRAFEVPPLEPKLERRLRDLFRPDVEAVEQLLDRELGPWKGRSCG